MCHGVVVVDVAVVDALVLAETFAVVVACDASVVVEVEAVAPVFTLAETLAVVVAAACGELACGEPVESVEPEAFAARNAARTAFSFARVFGPMFPYPSSPGFAIPCFTWKRWIAASVRRPSMIVSLPEEPS